MKTYTLSLFLMAMIIGSMMACSTEGELSSAGIKATDIVPLKDDTGNTLAQITFNGNPSSTQDPNATKTVGVPFTVDIALGNLQLSALNVITSNAQNEPKILIDITFIADSTVNRSQSFHTDIFKSSAITPVQFNQLQGQFLSLPFPIENLAVIDFKINGSVMATYPPKNKR